jgi:uncharacterized membrane protein YphA (DoxX/SURF4 family)
LLSLVLAVIGALLLIGCLTRFVAVVAALLCLASMFAWFPGPCVGIFESRTTTAFAIVTAMALSCLGAGAFSVDARLFGRREVIIPKNPPYSK